MREEDDWFDPDFLHAGIDSESQARKADPIGTVTAMLKDIGPFDSEEGSLTEWRFYAAQTPWRAEDVLTCLDLIIEDPPAELVQILQEQSDLFLYHHDDSATPYSYEDTLAWLIQVARKLRKIYQDLKSEMN